MMDALEERMERLLQEKMTETFQKFLQTESGRMKIMKSIGEAMKRESVLFPLNEESELTFSGRTPHSGAMNVAPYEQAFEPGVLAASSVLDGDAAELEMYNLSAGRTMQFIEEEESS